MHDRSAFEPLDGDSLAELRALAECLPDRHARRPAARLACLVGYFGYETIGLVENLPRAPQSELALPDMLFARPDADAGVRPADRQSVRHRAALGGREAIPTATIERAGERIDEALRKLGEAVPETDRLADLPDLDLEAGDGPGAITSAWCFAAKDYITAGDIFQVVLAQRFTCPFPLPPLALYRALRRVNPSPFLYFLDLPGFAVVGSSPEILVRVRDGEVTDPPDRRNAPARRDRERGQGERGQPAGRSQGMRRTPDAARPRPQRRRPGGGRGQRDA